MLKNKSFTVIALSSLLIMSSLLIGLSSVSAKGFKPGKERWSIKTSLPVNADLANPTFIEFSKIINLEDPSDVTKNDKRYQSKRIPKFQNALNIKEGDIVSTRGWLHLVAAESDGDYHIQISGSQNSGDNCLIVEVPTPASPFVTSHEVQSTSSKVREFIRSKLLRGKEPSVRGSIMKHPPYVTVTGQLFYDDAHVGDPPRGKKGMHAATLWEIHPITDISFAPKPAE